MIGTVRRRVVPSYDTAGLALVGGFVAWAWLSALLADTTAWAHTAAATVAVLGYWLARRLAAEWGWVVPFALAVAVLMLFIASGSPGWSGRPTAPPLYYGNANGALAAAGAGAALVAATLAPRRAVVPCILLAGVLVAATLAAESRAAALGVMVTVVLAVGAVLSPALRRPAVAVAAAMGVLAIGVSLALGAGVGEDTEVAGAAEAGLTARRADLWHSALKLTRDHPVVGVGPRQFSERSPVAARDPDTGEAHSEPLQAAAELGLPGAALLVGIAAWALAGPLAGRRSSAAAGTLGPTVAAVVAGTATAQACIDYIAQFATVVLTVAAVLGASQGRRATLPEPDPGGAGTGVTETPAAHPGRWRPGVSDPDGVKAP